MKSQTINPLYKKVINPYFSQVADSIILFCEEGSVAHLDLRKEFARYPNLPLPYLIQASGGGDRTKSPDQKDFIFGDKEAVFLRKVALLYLEARPEITPYSTPQKSYAFFLACRVATRILSDKEHNYLIEKIKTYRGVCYAGMPLGFWLVEDSFEPTSGLEGIYNMDLKEDQCISFQQRQGDAN